MSSSEVQLPLLEHFTPFTQPTQFYTKLHGTCFGSLVQKPIIKEYAEVVRRSQEDSGSIKQTCKMSFSLHHPRAKKFCPKKSEFFSNTQFASKQRKQNNTINKLKINNIPFKYTIILLKIPYK